MRDKAIQSMTQAQRARLRYELRRLDLFDTDALTGKSLPPEYIAARNRIRAHDPEPQWLWPSLYDLAPHLYPRPWWERAWRWLRSLG